MQRQPSTHHSTRETPAGDPNSITCFIAGFRYHEGLDLTHYLVAGEPLDLIAEPDNPHDPHAVRLEHLKSRIGYVPRAHTTMISRWLSDGMQVHAEIIAVDWDRPPWEAVQIQISVAAAQPSCRQTVLS